MTTLLFTGKPRDIESGLDYFGARFYGNQLCRWASPDKLFADNHIRYPQSWNLYQYAADNPINLIDRNGLDALYVSDISPDEQYVSGGGSNIAPIASAGTKDESNESQASVENIPAPSTPEGELLPPPVPPPDDKDGNSNKWKPTPGTGSRPTKWVPERPCPSGKGGQPSSSWDPAHGHWDMDNGKGDRVRRLPDGTEVDHNNNPIKNGKIRTAVKVGAAIGVGYCIYRIVRLIPSLVFPPLWPTIPLNAVAP